MSPKSFPLRRGVLRLHPADIRWRNRQPRDSDLWKLKHPDVQSGFEFLSAGAGALVTSVQQSRPDNHHRQYRWLDKERLELIKSNGGSSKHDRQTVHVLIDKDNSKLPLENGDVLKLTRVR